MKKCASEEEIATLLCGQQYYFMDVRLAQCLQQGLPLYMDVYDLAGWCCIAELSKRSYPFYDSQKEKSDGYDGAIVCGSKKMDSLKTMVKRLKKMLRRKQQKSI